MSVAIDRKLAATISSGKIYEISPLINKHLLIRDISFATIPKEKRSWDLLNADYFDYFISEFKERAQRTRVKSRVAIRDEFYLDVVKVFLRGSLDTPHTNEEFNNYDKDDIFLGKYRIYVVLRQQKKGQIIDKMLIKSGDYCIPITYRGDVYLFIDKHHKSTGKCLYLLTCRQGKIELRLVDFSPHIEKSCIRGLKVDSFGQDETLLLTDGRKIYRFGSLEESKAEFLLESRELQRSIFNDYIWIDPYSNVWYFERRKLVVLSADLSEVLYRDELVTYEFGNRVRGFDGGKNNLLLIEVREGQYQEFIFSIEPVSSASV